jgi:hypothetical protein
MSKHKEKHQEKSKRNENPISEVNILCYTSLFFITNIFTALYQEYFLYAFFFLLLTISSIIVHTNDTIYTNLMDKLFISFIVVYGGLTMYNKYNDENYLNAFIVVIAFIFCIWVYILGFLHKDYCFHSEKCIADKYHCLLHLISSVGHHLIIFM